MSALPRACYFWKSTKTNKSTSNYKRPNVFTQGAGYDSSENNQSPPINGVPMAFSSFERCPYKVGVKKSDECPIMIMHELFSSKDHWSAWSKLLFNATNRKVIAFDARNHGDSVHAVDMSLKHLAEDIRSSMAEMDIDCATMIGHRMGARAMMMMAFKYPKMVKDLILVDMTPKNPDSHLLDIPKYLDAMHKVTINSYMTFDVARKTVNSQLTKSIPSPVVRDLVLSNVLQINNFEYKWRANLIAISMNVAAIEAPILIDTNHTFDKPTLFIDGYKSPTIDKEKRKVLRKSFQRAEFQSITDAGNQVQLRTSHDFFNCVREFLARNSK